MNTIHAIIFDLDGVICFTDKYHYQAWKELADREGIYFDEKINDRLRGVSRMQSLDIILERASREYTEEEKESMAAMKNESYVKLLENMSTKDLSDEVKNTLDELRHRGYKLAIGSSSKNTKKILKQIGLVDYFDAISDGTNITKSKPDPEVFLKAADMVEEKPQNCLVVEDAAAGIDAACAGGFLSAGIGDAAAHEGVTYPIRTFGELLSIAIFCGIVSSKGYAMKSAIAIAHELGKERDADCISQTYELYKSAAIRHFYNEEKGLFLSGKSKQISYASQVWLILGGAVSQEEGLKILHNVAEYEDAIDMVTPYMHHYYIEALISCGAMDEALDVMRKYWGGMAKLGADTFWELYNPKNPDESPYGGTIVNSYCHAWSCAPAYFLRKYF